MKKMNEITQKQSYEYRKKENAIYLISNIDKSVSGQYSYERIKKSGSGLNFEVIYKKKNATGTAEKFSETVDFKLDIIVKFDGEVTKEKIKELINEYLIKHGPKAKINLKVIFQEPDGTVEDSTVTGISQNAELDLTK